MPEYIPLLFFGVVLILLLMGFPVAFTLGGVALIFGYIYLDPAVFGVIPNRIMGGIIENYILVAVPLFVFMGIMLEKSGLAGKMLESMALLFGRFHGGLAVAVIVVGTLLAASTGIVGATVITMGLISLPTMLKYGYSPRISTATIAASGTLGQIIPPSIVLVLLGSTLRVSVGDLFKGALLPGLLLVGGYLAYVLVMSRVKPRSMPAVSGEARAAFDQLPMGQKIRQLLVAFVLPFLLILTVLGSIFLGIATPTEAAGLGAMGAIILAIVLGYSNGTWKWTILLAVMRETTRITSMVFVILIGANVFSLVFRLMGGDTYLTDLILDADLSPYLFLAMVMLLIFVVGFFIDFIEIIFIFVPVVLPIFAELYALSPAWQAIFGAGGQERFLVWIGILMAMNLQTSFMTPPFGFSLFYLKGVAPASVKTTDIYRGIMPFIGIQLAMLALVILFPEMVLVWLN